jgi:ABC-type transporter Mla MlaB component
MLRITVAETATEQRWTIEGRLVEPWVAELRTSWKNRHRAQNERTCTVDLSAVTFIDRGGQRLLRAMSKEGPQFIATGTYIKRVLDQLKPNGKRRLLKLISCLFIKFDVSVR